jgi:hypothetical protein
MTSPTIIPGEPNFGRVSVEDVDVYGFYTGLIVNTAHTRLKHSIAKWCVLGYGLTGSRQGDSIDPHASLFEMIGSESCVVHLAGWSHAGTGSLAHREPFYLIAQLWDIEDAPPGHWYSTHAHLIDANSQVFGHANYTRVRSSAGTEPHLLVAGGTNIALSNLNTRGVSGATHDRKKPGRHPPVPIVRIAQSSLVDESLSGDVSRMREKRQSAPTG